jgi:hypothetical protein
MNTYALEHIAEFTLVHWFGMTRVEDVKAITKALTERAADLGGPVHYISLDSEARELPPADARAETIASLPVILKACTGMHFLVIGDESDECVKRAAMRSLRTMHRGAPIWVYANHVDLMKVLGTYTTNRVVLRALDANVRRFAEAV